MADSIVLNTLADQINNEHRLGEVAARDAIEHAIKAGELLIQAKTQVNHGEWIPWIESNLTVTPRQVQRYMRVASHKDELKYDGASHLSLEAALDVIATPANRNDGLSVMQHMEIAGKYIDEIEGYL